MGALDNFLHAKAAGTIQDDVKVSALLCLLDGISRLPKQSSRAMLQRILSELALLAKPPLGLADEAHSTLVGLVQQPFLASLSENLQKVPVPQVAEEAAPPCTVVNI